MSHSGIMLLQNYGQCFRIARSDVYGNLGNTVVEVVKLILEHAGFQHPQIQSEGKSKTHGVASKVTYIFGNEDEALYVEETLDFYVHTTHPFHPKIVYLLIGDCESQSSDTQLAITTLGHPLDPIRNKMVATLFMKGYLQLLSRWSTLKCCYCATTYCGHVCC